MTILENDSAHTEAEQQVRSLGYSHVYTWVDKPNAHYEAHSHTFPTSHLILEGSMTVCYPDDQPNHKEKFGKGARLDVPAGKAHETWAGEEGCTMVVGE
ncbi:hypothetical protein NLI96_g11610 [Meripilus lineatus]|uniref:Uncharacterized protein n=1 Tax=Meripilus lineatus TaxID=2056292 RepID=A0AAD5YAN8_9APHY|nr:hypothetical protein NLI96_g11610 [Physisporinus lineatus]